MLGTPQQPSAAPPASQEEVSLESRISDFEQLWLRGQRPLIASFLPGAGEQRQRLLVELVHAELELRLEAGHPATIASINNLVHLYSFVDPQALPLSVEALKVARASLGATHPYTLTAMGNLAAQYWHGRRLDQSIPLFEETLALQKEHLGLNHENTLLTAINLAINYRDAGQLRRCSGWRGAPALPQPPGL
jgi:hypothetical protein